MWRALLLTLASLAGARAAPELTDMQRWAGLLAQAFLAHSDGAAHAHAQLQLFKQLVANKVR